MHHVWENFRNVIYPVKLMTSINIKFCVSNSIMPLPRFMTFGFPSSRSNKFTNVPYICGTSKRLMIIQTITRNLTTSLLYAKHFYRVNNLKLIKCYLNLNSRLQFTILIQQFLSLSNAFLKFRRWILKLF